MSNAHIAWAVGLVALLTFSCRVAPFVFLRGRGRSELLDFLSAAMPLGVMLVLIAYSVGDVGRHPSDISTWLPAVAGIAGTAGLHLWKRSVALSLIGGTAIYVAASVLLT